MRPTTGLLTVIAVLLAACGGDDDPAPLTIPTFSSPTDTAAPVATTQPGDGVNATVTAADAAVAQMELGGVRADLAFRVEDVLINDANTCAAVMLSAEPAGTERFLTVAYMVHTAGRSAGEIFPRAEAMNPDFLDRWDTVVGDDPWGLLALFPAERDVNDVATLCGGAFLDAAERRFVALELEQQ